MKLVVVPYDANLTTALIWIGIAGAIGGIVLAFLIRRPHQERVDPMIRAGQYG